MSLIFGDKQTGWDADSLALILTRYSRPLEGRFCRNPKCGALREWRADGKGRKGACGLCSRCFQRWDYAGRPAEVPDRYERVHPPGTWRERRCPPATARSQLKSGDYGYRPSSGTAGMSALGAAA